jgi:hypothetical protein
LCHSRGRESDEKHGHKYELLQNFHCSRVSSFLQITHRGKTESASDYLQGNPSATTGFRRIARLNGWNIDPSRFIDLQNFTFSVIFIRKREPASLNRLASSRKRLSFQRFISRNCQVD